MNLVQTDWCRPIIGVTVTARQLEMVVETFKDETGSTDLHVQVNPRQNLLPGMYVMYPDPVEDVLLMSFHREDDGTVWVDAPVFNRETHEEEDALLEQFFVDMTARFTR